MKHGEDIIPLANMHHAERNSHVPFEAQAIRDSVRQLIRDYDRIGYNAWVAYDQKDKTTKIPVGFLVGHCEKYYFSYSYCASQEVWYIRPDYRGTRAAFVLLKSFEEWARLRGVLEIFTGVTTEDQSMIDKFHRMMPKIGYKPMGSFFVKETVK